MYSVNTSYCLVIAISDSEAKQKEREEKEKQRKRQEKKAEKERRRREHEARRAQEMLAHSGDTSDEELNAARGMCELYCPFEFLGHTYLYARMSKCPSH